MAPVLSRSLSTLALSSLPSSSFSHPLASTGTRLSLRNTFLPRNGLRKGFSCAGLKWKVEKKSNRIGIRCEAAVAEKEATESPGEKFEYQAEVGL